ncbi:MAG: ribbon-helix-helix protein, CopG family [Cyanophyceae cyanobacterium]
MTTTDKPVTKKVTVALPLETIEKIKLIANRHGLTMTDAIRRAVTTEDYIENAIKEGNKVLLQKEDNYREVVFR